MTRFLSLTCRSVLVMLLAAVPVGGLAQDLDKLQPEPAPPQLAPAPLPETGPETVQPLQPGAFPGEEVLLPALVGLAFYASEGVAQTSSPRAGLTVEGIPMLDTPELRGVVDFFLDAPVSRESLERIATSVRIYLSALGYPFSVVYLPEQDITDGVVRYVVVVSHLQGEIEVEGAKHFSESLYEDAIRIEPGESLDRSQLQADLEWLNRNPFRAATASTASGDEPGTTRIVLRVNERRPWLFFTGANNTGTETTTVERYYAGFNWGNAFGLGHQLSAQWTSSWEQNAMRSVSGSYALDLPWRHSLSFTGAYSKTDGVVAPPFVLKGESWQIGANYDVPLQTAGDAFNHSLQFGADFKSSDNNFTFADEPISDNLTHVVQARASYFGSLITNGAVTSFGATLVGAPGDLTSRNKDEFFDLSRSGAKASYLYLRANASRRTSLDSFKAGLSWTLRGELQVASSNLIGSEQFGGGGSSTVRGYEEGEIYKDNGYLISNELRLPAWSPGLARGRFADQLQMYVFQDYAYLWSTDKLPDEVNVDLSSAGLGLDYFMGQAVSLRAAYGWQFTESGSSDTGDDSRAHLSMRVSF